MTITINDRLTLEPLDEKHAPELYELAAKNSSHLKKWLPWVNNMQGIEFIEDFIRESVKKNKDGSEYPFIIIKDGKMLGRIGLHKIDGQNKIAEIGYWVAQDIQGKGIVTASCKSLINHSFHQLQFNRIEIKCAAENYKSQKIPERLGFTFEGIIRQGEWIDNRFVDLKLYSLLRQDLIQQ